MGITVDDTYHSVSRLSQRDTRASAPNRSFGSGLGSLVVSIFLVPTFGCEPKIVISSLVYPEANESTSLADAGIDAGNADEPTTDSWSTGFEEGFCDYSTSGGFCYARGSAATVRVFGTSALRVVSSWR